MSLPFLPLPHRLRPGDVLPVQLVNRLGERLVDARAMVERQHRVFDPAGGAHEHLGQPFAARIYTRPPGSLGRWDYAKWADVPPLWGYGPWDSDATWDYARFRDGSTSLSLGRDAVRITARVSGLNKAVSYRGRVLVEIDTTIADEKALAFGADWQPGSSSFAYTIPLDVLVGARLVCLQVF